jgi:outer membrane protein assembly factor BamB/orotate phosphoribosyltransferase
MTLASIQQTIARIGFYTQEKDIPLINKQGGKYHWLFDLRRVFMETSTLQAIAQEFWGRYASRGPFQLAGMETAAIPLLTALMLTAPDDRGPVNGLIIRKNRKTSGLCRAVEGEILNLPIILVDDTINSGNSAEKACAMLSLEGHEVRDMFVVIDFLSQKGRHWRRANGVSIQTLFTLKDFGLQISSTRTAAMQSYRELWRTTTPGGIAYHIVPKSAPLLVENKIYRGCDAAKMQAFSAETGGLIWEYEATGAASSRKGIWSSPAWHDGKLYFGAYNGTLYCLDATTGEEIWTRPEGEWVGASPLIVDRHNLVYFGIEYARPWAQGSLGAYDMDTGEKIWEHQVEKLQHGSPGYWRGGDLVIWGSADHEMLGLDARTGRIVWRFPTRRSVKYAPAIDEERRLTAFASFDKSIYILDVATGEKRGEWVTGEICYTTPLFVGNKLFCGSGDRELYIIDVDHMVLIRRIPLHARIYASPRVVDGRVIVATNGGRVVEIDAATLEIRGMLQLPDAVTNAVVVSDDQRRIIVSTYMNHLYAFERTVSKEHLMSLAEKTVTAEVDVDDFPVIQTSRSSNLQNFELVRTDTDVSHMLDEIKAHSEMWIANNERQDE